MKKITQDEIVASLRRESQHRLVSPHAQSRDRSDQARRNNRATCRGGKTSDGANARSHEKLIVAERLRVDRNGQRLTSRFR